MLETLLPRRLALPAVVVLISVLSACTSTAPTTGRKPPTTSSSRPQPRPPIVKPPAAQIQNIPGVAGVLGATEPELNRQFGAPRLDVWEGDARKLQYGNTRCVLDIYLYPLEAGTEPQATFLDARNEAGQDIDRVACVNALRKR